MKKTTLSMRNIVIPPMKFSILHETPRPVVSFGNRYVIYSLSYRVLHVRWICFALLIAAVDKDGRRETNTALQAFTLYFASLNISRVLTEPMQAISWILLLPINRLLTLVSLSQIK